MVGKKTLKLDESLYSKGKEVAFSLGRGRSDKTFIVVFILGIASFVLLALSTEGEDWWAVFLFGLIFLASEWFAIPHGSGGKLSIAVFPVVMAMMVSGYLGACVVTLFGLPVFFAERGEYGWRRVAFNASQYILCAGVSAWIFHLVGGEPLKSNIQNAGGLVAPCLLATLVFFALNSIIAAFILAPPEKNVFRFWRSEMLELLPSYLLYGAIGFLSALAYVRLQFPAVLFLAVPLIASRKLYTHYDMMRNVCDDTTLAVIHAIEENSPLELGHSIGVAKVAVDIAQALHFPQEDIHYVRLAGLLHDVGKLAIPDSIFEKKGELSEEEYAEIKRYPLILKDALAGEKYFGAVAPAIIHHQEMLEGRGYPDGIAGDSIPLVARILAVADAYDAMQRPAAYRQPKTPYEAASEIVRSKGIQFDPEVVDGFIEVVTAQGIWGGAPRDIVPEKTPAEGAIPQQPSLEDLAKPGAQAAKEETPSEGITYRDVTLEIEKDLKGWKKQKRGIHNKGISEGEKDDKSR
ncbi:MAG: HD domain-containing protein [Actinomycetota bacterium]|nr:HD domain-containing protein [Actinomycetota bacterium]